MIALPLSRFLLGLLSLAFVLTLSFVIRGQIAKADSQKDLP